MEVSGQLHIPAALPQGKEPPLLIGNEDGWTGLLALPLIEPWFTGHLASHCID
jgi:hypothetical protein